MASKNVEAKKKFTVPDDEFRSISAQLREIEIQLDCKSGSPLAPEQVKIALQNIIENQFGNLETRLPAEVNYRENLNDRIKATQLGMGWLKSFIKGECVDIERTEHKDIEAKTKNFVLIWPGNGDMSLAELQGRISSCGLRFALPIEVLDWGQRYQSLIRHEIIILGECVPFKYLGRISGTYLSLKRHENNIVLDSLIPEFIKKFAGAFMTLAVRE